MTSAIELVDVLDEPRAIEGRSPFVLAMRRLRKDQVAVVSLVLIVLIVLMAIFAPVFTAIPGHPPNEQYRDIGLTPDGLPRGPNGAVWVGAPHPPRAQPPR